VWILGRNTLTTYLHNPKKMWMPEIGKRTLLRHLKLRHPRCVCNNKVKDNVGQNTTSLLVGC